MSAWKMMIAIALAMATAAAMAVSPSSPAHVEWHRFLANYGKSYDTDAEHDARYDIFRRNLESIRAHNAKADLGLEPYWIAVNAFADQSGDEFAARLTLRAPARHRSSPHHLYRLQRNDTLPDSVDWRKQGVVTPVKNQGQCGSCWSFAATGSMEGAYALDRHQAASTTTAAASFSEQELIDCVDGGNFTCANGGEYTDAFAFVIENGTAIESEYRYVSGQDQDQERCRLAALPTIKPFHKYVTLESGDEQALKAAVAERPGVAVAIDASHMGFQFYFRGVYKSKKCSSTELDHAVLVVGYGTCRQGGDYWVVKNSWGTDWGQHGYILMARNRDNMCGIATQPAYILTEAQVDPALYVALM